jgi:hypothetical protein
LFEILHVGHSPKTSNLNFPLFKLFRIAVYVPVCSNTETVTRIWKILFVDGSNALKSDLHIFLANPGAKIKTQYLR